MKKVVLFLIVVFLFRNQICAQTGIVINWTELEQQVSERRLLDQASARLDSIFLTAYAKKDYFTTARAGFLQMQVRDLRTEDTLFFINQSVFDSLIHDPQVPVPLQFCTHLVLAQRLETYNTVYKKFPASRYRLKAYQAPYPYLNKLQTDSVIENHYERALQLSPMMAPYPVVAGLWLSNKPTQFLVKPSWEDIVLSNQLSYLSRIGIDSRVLTAKSSDWVDWTPRQMLQQLDTLFIGKPTGNTALAIYRKWLQRHADTTELAQYINLLLKQELYYGQQYYESKFLRNRYAGLLQNELQKNRAGVKVYALSVLFDLLVRTGNLYAPQEYANYSFFSDETERKKFEPSYRYLIDSAVAMVKAREALLDSFPVIKIFLQRGLAATKLSRMGIRLQRYQMPDKPISCEIRFRNMDSVYLTVWKVPIYMHYSALNDSQLKEWPIVRKKSIKLPVANDRNEHITHIGIEGLPVGSYVLGYEGDGKGENGGRAYVKFTITNLTTTAADDWLLVFDRVTGKPADRVQISSLQWLLDSTGKKLPAFGKKYKTDKKGVVRISKKEYSDLLVMRENDSLVVNSGTGKMSFDQEVYDKEEYNNLVEYYYENTEVFFYTDRSIYRPGQTVYYKAFFFTRNPQTGEKMLLTAKHLRGGLFKNYLKRLLKTEEPFLYLEDAYGRDLDSVRVLPDEWGAMSGQFELPITAATGEWTLYTDFFNDNSNSFQVEEYKRPSFEVKLIKPQQELLPGMPFEFRIETISYSGAPMAGVKLVCDLQSSIQARERENSRFIEAPEYQDSFILFTNEKGWAILKVNDTLAKRVLRTGMNMLHINYQLSVRAVAFTGEVQDAETEIGISLHPVSVKWQGERVCEKNKPQIIKWQFIHSIAGPVRKPARIMIRSANPDMTSQDDLFFPADLFSGTPLSSSSILKGENQRVLLDTLLSAETTSFKIPFVLPAGHYVVNVSAIQDRQNIGETERPLTVFEQGDTSLGSYNLFHLSPRVYKSGDTVDMAINNPDNNASALIRIIYLNQKRKRQVVNEFYVLEGNRGASIFRWKVPRGLESEVLIQKFVLQKGVLVSAENRIIIEDRQEPPLEIKVERFRKFLEPGKKEEWAVQLTANGKPVSATLMTVLYDASLDKVKEHTWPPVYFDRINQLNSSIRDNHNGLVGNSFKFYKSHDESFSKPVLSNAPIFWWIYPGDLAEAGLLSKNTDVNRYETQVILSDELFIEGGGGQLMGKAPGIQVATGDELNEVVVTGLGVRKKSVTAAVSITKNKIISLSAYRRPLIILDGKPFTGDLDSLNQVASIQGLVVDPGMGVALYGSLASKGVLVLSTTGPVVLPELAGIQPIVTANSLTARTNFKETAFYKPALVSDKNGMIKIPFEIPESLTRWNWKMLANDRRPRFAYREETAYTSLPLMIQPHLPRFIHTGDSVWLSARIINLDSLPANAMVRIRIEDAATGQLLNYLGTQPDTFSVSIGAGGEITAGFWIKESAQSATRFVVKMYASTSSFADGEQHEIAILPRYQLRQISEDRHLLASDGQVQLPFPETVKPFGASFSVPVQPVSALLKHLRYLSSYPFDCAEQLSNKILGDLLAIRSVRTNKVLQDSYARAANEMKAGRDRVRSQADILWAGSTPWLNAKEKFLAEQHETFVLLDSNRAMGRMTANWAKLQVLQNANGGLSWFPDLPADYPISVYVGEVLARMIYDSLLTSDMIKSLAVQQFIHKLSDYIAYDRAATEHTRNTGFFLNVVYVLSRLGTVYKDDSLLMSWRERIIGIWPRAYDLRLSQQARLIAGTLRLPNMDHLRPAVDSLLQSIVQLAIIDDKGMRWKEIANNTGMSESAEELLYLLNDAFIISGSFYKERGQIARWILQTRAEEVWSSTVAVSAAASLLEMNGIGLMVPSQTALIVAGTQEIETTNDPLHGAGTAYLPFTTAMEQINVQAKSDSPVSLTTTWYYYDSTGTEWRDKGVMLKKIYWIRHQAKGEWEPWTYGQVLQTGDELKVKLLVETDRELKYVVIEDERAAAFSPLDPYSGLQYGDRFSCYKTIRNATIQFFAASLPSGASSVEYTVKVEHVGSFRDGIATLRCIYEPSVGAGSVSGNVRVAK